MTEISMVRKKLDQLLNLKDGWDGRHAPAPNLLSANLLESFLKTSLENGLVCDRIVADVEGGVAAYFFNKQKLDTGGWNRCVGVLISNDRESSIYYRDIAASTTTVTAIEESSQEVIKKFLG